MWYLFEYDGFQWLTQVKQNNYLQDYRRHSAGSCEPKEEWPHACLDNYNGRQIELFHMKNILLKYDELYNVLFQ